MSYEAAFAAVGCLLLLTIAPLFRNRARAPRVRSQEVILIALGGCLLFPAFAQRQLFAFGGAAVFPLDIVTVIAAVGFCFGPRRLHLSFPPLVALGLLLVVALSVARGVLSYGLGDTINQVRPLLAVLAVAAFLFAQADGRQPDLLRRFVYCTAAGLLAVGVYRITQIGLGNANEQVLDPSTGVLLTARPIISVQAAFVGGAFLLAAYDFARTGRGRYLIGALDFMVGVVLAQHRSVWAATGLAGLVLLMLSRRSAMPLVLSGFVLVGLSAPLFFYGPTDGLSARIAESFASASLVSGTGGARTQGAEVLVDQHYAGSGFDIALGAPMGTSFRRVVGGTVVDFNPHNWFVFLLIRVGIGGLALVFVLAAMAFRSDRASPATLRISLLVLLLVYGAAYNVEAYLVPFALLALAGRRAAPERSTVEEETQSRKGHKRVGAAVLGEAD